MRPEAGRWPHALCIRRPKGACALHPARGVRGPHSQPFWEAISLETEFGLASPQISPSQRRAALAAHPAHARADSCVYMTALSSTLYMQSSRSQTPRPLSQDNVQKSCRAPDALWRHSPALPPRQGPRPFPALALRAGQELVVLAVGRAGLRGHGLEVVHH